MARKLISAEKASKKRVAKKESKRTETVSVRLDPKLRYLADLAARRQRRTLSSYIEWAISHSLSAVAIDESGKTVAERADFLWDVDEPDRFVTLALNYESLLTHDEQVLWKMIKETKSLWDTGKDGEPIYRQDALAIHDLRTHWNKFVDISKGAAPRSDLPLAPF